MVTVTRTDHYCDWCDASMPNRPIGEPWGMVYVLKARDRQDITYDLCDECTDAFNELKAARANK